MMAEFRKYFEAFGSVVDAVVMFDRQTQRSRGFGFVTFQEDAVVHDIMMGTHEINGKMVEVKRAEPKENRSGRGARAEFAGGSSPALGGGPAPFTGTRGRTPPFGAGGRGAGAGYGAGSSFPYNNGGAPFSGNAGALYGQQPAYGYPAAGYGYNNQMYSASTAYGYTGRGAGAAYNSAEGGTAAGSFPVTLPPQGPYGLQAQDGQAPYTQAEYAAAVRNQQGAQVQAQQQARTGGEGTYGSQPY